MQSKVSVIIPVFNGEKYIAMALESVFSQTYQNYEVIVIDDGSTDRTEEVIASFSGKLKLIRQPNSGPACARNKGVENSIGELVAFLDHDDVWLPDKLHLQVKCLEQNKLVSLVYSDFGTFNDQGIIEESASQTRGLFMPSGYIFPYLFFDPICWTSTVLVKRSCLDEIGAFDEDENIHMAEDYDLWLRLSKKFEFHYINKVTAMYRQSPNSLSRNVGVGVKAEIHMLQKVMKTFPEIRKEIGTEKIKKRLSVPYFELAYHQSLAGEKTEARKNFLQSIYLWPMNGKYWVSLLASFMPPSAVSKIMKIKEKFVGWSPSLRASVGGRPKK